MFNKLSFLPSESLYHVCCLALDDVGDNEPNSSLSQKSDVIDSEDVIKHRSNLDKLIDKLCPGH